MPAGNSRAALKIRLARGVCLLGLDRVLLAWQKIRHARRFIRVVNYHDTPAKHAGNFRRQLVFYKQHFVGVGQRELGDFLARGEWKHDKPGLIVSFDDGLRSNFDVAAPLLEEFGFTGWFLIPSDFPDQPVESQAAWALEHLIDHAPVVGPDPRVAMTWDEIRTLSQGHEIGCHTRTHCRLRESLSPAQLADEIGGAKAAVETRLGRNVDVFCWVGGEEWAYSPQAAKRIRDSEFRYAFMTCSAAITAVTNSHQLHRTNVEADWPLELVRLQLCGVADWANAAKRRRVNRITR